MQTFPEMLRAAHWARSLPTALFARIEADTMVRRSAAGSLVCRKGEPVEHWIGVDNC